ncbi:YopX family protein [Levilactobacillus brevis]|uniref:YopX family protein n=1 Tax=Levilactobacillus brevis TaxID=1580 RepID=UPI0013A5322D|nr:YopX family protein [Levilactobacillus brevis]
MVPKFRGWDRNNHVMYDFMMMCFNVNLKNVLYRNNLTDFDIDMSTGLKDANGNMIYENDIIKYFGGNERVKIKTTYGIVFYDSEHGCFNSRIQNEEHNKGGISPLDDLIVGNVHENPELLEAQHDTQSD